jgi:RNA polymerase sigma-70 factor, ECF subfamily
VPILADPAPSRVAEVKAEESFEHVFEEYKELLKSIATRKFRVPTEEAENLAHEVFLTYLRRHSTVVDLRSWMVGAICHASRHYWRLNGRATGIDTEAVLERVDPASARILESLPDQLAAREALELLSPRAREVLRMRYFEGATIPEIAQHFRIKPDSAKQLIQRGLRRAREVYANEAPRRVGRTGELRDALTDFVNAFRELV